MNQDYRPRFSFEISEEQQNRANKLIRTYGLRKAIFSTVLDDVLDLIEEHGEIAIGAILSIKPREVLRSLNTANRIGGIVDGNTGGSSS